MKRKPLRQVMLMAIRAAHREFNGAPACHVSLATVRQRRVVVQRDHNGDAYPLADLRRCWRPDGVFRTPLHTALDVTR